MENVSEEIQLILSNLEDARSEQDWDLVGECINDLESIYDILDRQENGFTQEYE
jgi:hypothetical protein